MVYSCLILFLERFRFRLLVQFRKHQISHYRGAVPPALFLKEGKRFAYLMLLRTKMLTLRWYCQLFYASISEILPFPIESSEIFPANKRLRTQRTIAKFYQRRKGKLKRKSKFWKVLWIFLEVFLNVYKNLQNIIYSAGGTSKHRKSLLEFFLPY